MRTSGPARASPNITAGKFLRISRSRKRKRSNCRRAPALGDVSWMTKLDLKGFGLKTPPAIHDGRAWHFGQEHYLVTCNPAARDSVLAQLTSFSASPDLSLPPPIYITDVTSVYAQFLLAGPRSRDVLRKLTSLNVIRDCRTSAAGRPVVAHVHSIVLRDDLPGGIPAFHLLVSREYARERLGSHSARRARVSSGAVRIARRSNCWVARHDATFPQGADVALARAEIQLRRGHRRRGRAWAGHRLLPRQRGTASATSRCSTSGYLGCGNSGRNTAIIRSNYRTPEGIPFYEASVQLYEQLSRELEWNLLFSQCGHLTLAHTDSAITGLRVRAENNQVLGVDSRIIYPDEIRKLVPAMDLSDRPRLPVLAALYHPPGGIIRHDAVVWGYARACDRMGIEIHPYTEVTGMRVARGKAQSVITTRGEIAAGAVLNATAGWASMSPSMAGVPLPIVSHPLQACVTEPLKPFLDKVIVSATLHVYVNQTDKGELVIGAEIDPYQSYSMKGTLPTLEQMATYTLELFPQLSRRARAAAVGRHLRHDAGFRADHRSLARSGKFLHGCRMGHVRIQGGAGGGQVAGRADRDGKDAEADRAVLAGAFLRRATGGGKSGGGGLVVSVGRSKVITKW